VGLLAALILAITASPTLEYRMSLDLFFVPRTPAFDTLNDPDFAPSKAQQKARHKLVSELLADFSGTELSGEVIAGSIEGMPGSMELRPGSIFWSLHGVDSDADIEMVHGVVDWFKAHGLICEDMQDAGFGNRRPQLEQALDSLDALMGAQLQSLQFDRNWATALILEWNLADGRIATQRLAHMGRCQLPELATLVEARVSALDHSRASEVFDNLRIRFDSGEVITLEGYVPDRLTVRAKTGFKD